MSNTHVTSYYFKHIISHIIFIFIIISSSSIATIIIIIIVIIIITIVIIIIIISIIVIIIILIIMISLIIIIIIIIVAIFYPFSQFCEMNTSLLSLQKQPNTAPNLFQRGVEYGKYVSVNFHTTNCRTENL